MRLRSTVAVGALLALLIVLAAAATAAQARPAYSVTKPKLSAAPVAGIPFTVTGVVSPKASAGLGVVKIKLSVLRNGRWDATGTYRASMGTGPPAGGYARRLSVPTDGTYAVRALHYRAGRLVATSPATSFEVARRITIDSMVNGWMAPRFNDTVAPPNTPLDVVFTTPADWASSDATKHHGAAHFIWGDFKKVDDEGLIWHTDGLRPGRYDWMRDEMPKWGTGSLVVTQQIRIDKRSHAEIHALPYLPASVSFGDVSAQGMGCDRSIAFLTRVFTRTSADPLIWRTDGLAPGRYDWKCWMDQCCYGTLMVDGPPLQVAIDSDPHDPSTVVPANTPVDLVFTGARMMCWRTIYFTSAGDFTKTRGYSDPLTWHSGGLAPGSYEWQCWMGPQCHHGTVVVQ